MAGPRFGWRRICCGAKKREHVTTISAENAEVAETFKSHSCEWPSEMWLCVLCVERRVDGIAAMVSQSVTVVNELGMHARAAAKFVHLATRFTARVKVARQGREMDGKSIMGILLLAAARGSLITISADGADEEAVIAALAALVESGFGEDVCNV